MTGPRAGFDDLDLARLRARPGIKWSTCEPDVLPAWVADMDYPLPPVVVRALRELIEEGDLGYPDWPDGSPLRAAFADRMLARYGWAADPTRVREHTRLIEALQLVLRLATVEGDTVAMQLPAYPPFLALLTAMRRRVVPVPMVDTPARWCLDQDALRAAAARGCRMLLLVNPHNPTGAVLTGDELAGVAEVARRYDLLVVSDEVHAELVHSPHRHTPFASLSTDAAARTVTLTSAAKAFNLAALRCATVHFGPERLLGGHDAQPLDLCGVSTLGVAATLAAWRSGDAWQRDLLAVLARNRARVAEFVGAHLPDVRLHPPEGTYLAWLDARAFDLGEPVVERVLRTGRVRLHGGAAFGPGAERFARLNFATSADLLEQILDGVGRALARPAPPPVSATASRPGAPCG